MPHSLVQYLNISISDSNGISISKINSVLPPGWNIRLGSVIEEIDELSNSSITGLDIKNGVLYITHKNESPYHQLIDLAIRALSQESARICMICGSFGKRRKEQEYKPCLCRTHYLDYINYVED